VKPTAVDTPVALAPPRSQLVGGLHAADRFFARLGVDPALARYVLVVFALTRIALVTVSLLAIRLLPPFPRGTPAPTFLAAWSRWDAIHYSWLATHGYQTGPNAINAAFFPLQPLAVHLVAPLVGGNADLAGIVVANLAFIAALFGLAALAAREFDVATARRAVLYLAVFPTSLFLFAGYAESLFLALAIWSVVATRQGRWWLAGLLGLLATLTRQVGVFLVLPFAVSYLARAGWRLRALRPDALWVLLIPLGAALYMGWLWRVQGDPLAFMHVEAYWQHVFLPFWTTLWRALGVVLRTRNLLDMAKCLVDLGAVLLVAALLVRGIRRQPPGDLLYGAAIWLVAVSYPSLAWWLQSDGRYMLAAFPCFMLLAWEGRRPWLHAAIVVIFSCGLLVLTQYFVRGALIV
jgi:Mannosyltransferase (PIG-V)